MILYGEVEMAVNLTVKMLVGVISPTEKEVLCVSFTKLREKPIGRS